MRPCYINENGQIGILVAFTCVYHYLRRNPKQQWRTAKMGTIFTDRMGNLEMYLIFGESVQIKLEVTSRNLNLKTAMGHLRLWKWTLKTDRYNLHTQKKNCAKKHIMSTQPYTCSEVGKMLTATCFHHRTNQGNNQHENKSFTVLLYTLHMNQGCGIIPVW